MMESIRFWARSGRVEAADGEGVNGVSVHEEVGGDNGVGGFALVASTAAAVAAQEDT